MQGWESYVLRRWSGPSGGVAPRVRRDAFEAWMSFDRQP